MKRAKSLDGNGWTLRLSGGANEVPFHYLPSFASLVPATVPGCVHTDLMKAGIIEDPYIQDHELAVRWIGHCDWTYERRFDLRPADLTDTARLDLVFEGLDTLATVELNGKPIARSANMHVPLRADIRNAARVGANHLVVHFASPRKYTDEAYRREPIPHVGGVPGGFHPHNQLRKMACNFGWDWGPDVATCGIWRPVLLESWRNARIRYVRPLVTEASENLATVRVHIDIEQADDTSALVSINACITDPQGGRLLPVQSDDRLAVFKINCPQRWWPVGHGEQPLYSLRIELRSKAGELLDVWEKQIGLKTSALHTSADRETDSFTGCIGSQFQLRINGKPIYVKGANWIPADCFPHRMTSDRYDHLLTIARDANFNVIRVWGGGIYESDEFYDVCDRLGLLVWQDFLFACSMYPEHAEYRVEVEREARHNVSRLAHHPSLAMYNGGNECIEAGLEWNEDFPMYRTSGKPWGLHYWHELLPTLLRELDPTRPYWPNSPYSGSMEIPTNSNEHGTRHIWDVWNGVGTYRNYLAHYPRMATEFGYHGPPTFATVANAIPEGQRFWNSPMMLLHNKNQRNGQQQTHDRIADDMVPENSDYDRWHYQAQVMQARALTMGVEWFRALYPWNSGAIFWQFDDCYPVSSWSAVDSSGRSKPLLHAARRFFAARLLTIKPACVVPQGQRADSLAVHLHNDSDKPWATRVLIRRMDLNCRELAQVDELVTVEPRSLARVAINQEFCGDGQCFLHASTDTGESSYWWFLPDKDMSYPSARYSGHLRTIETGYELTIEAHTLLRDIVIQVDRIDPHATVSDSFTTLLADQSATFRIATKSKLTSDQLLAPPVFQCVNVSRTE